MYWKMIFKRSAQAAAITFVVLAGLNAEHVRQEHLAEVEAKRFRWTDKNRWEK